MNRGDLEREGPCMWRIPQHGKMRVPGRIYASEKMLPGILSDNAADQVINVACLPGIVGASMAMPDIHWGYGFPIGGVAAFDVDEGIVSPGGVGYDINCGVRLMASRLTRQDIEPHLTSLTDALYHRIPTGVGSEGALRISRNDLPHVTEEGARWAVAQGMGNDEDLDHIEEGGCMKGADPEQVSPRAWERGKPQIGTLGSGNHFIEIGCVDTIYDDTAATVLGLDTGTITLTIHCGSRGFGHQICDDHLTIMDRVTRKYGLELPDRQLACVPVGAPEGQAYLGAMRCAVNYAFANRQVIAHHARQTFAAVLKRKDADIGLRTVYEVAHNIAKIETHEVEGCSRRLCVHRKGATRAFAGSRKEIPAAYKTIGQPVLIPGDMGRYSFVLTGTEGAMQSTFGSTCHGAGRLMSRHKGLKAARGRNIARELADAGITVRARSKRTLGEEMPEVYKDVSDVVEACAEAGISKLVARIRPLGCIKG